jgi:pantetheine-phosphate adenylyltransferase
LANSETLPQPAFVKRAIYAGSFDPVTNGHLDVIERAAKLCDEVVVAVAFNPEKRGLFTPDERVALLNKAVAGIKNVRVTSFHGLLVEFARNAGASAVIRGLRAVSDFEFEFQMALMNRRLEPRLETLFLMPKEEYSYVSSRLVKEVASLGGDVTHFVPLVVANALADKFGHVRR